MMERLSRCRFVLAVIAGFIMLAVMHTLDGPIFGFFGHPYPFFTLTSLSFGVLGALFGYLWPRSSWRWGLWVTVPAFIALYALGLWLASSASLVAPLLPRFVPSIYLACFGSFIASRFSSRNAS